MIIVIIMIMINVLVLDLPGQLATFPHVLLSLLHHVEPVEDLLGPEKTAA